MASDFYTPTGTPQTGAPGASAPVRNEYNLIAAGFAKIPNFSTGIAGQAIIVNDTLSGYKLATVPQVGIQNTWTAQQTFTAGIVVSGADGTVVAEGFNTGSFTQANAVSGTWYTAISAATLAAATGVGMWNVVVISGNTAAYAGVITVPTTVSPVVTLTQIAAGTFAAAQIDGSGNFQVKQTSGSPATITAIWARIGT